MILVISPPPGRVRLPEQLKSDRSLRTPAVELAAIQYIGGRIAHIYLVDILELQHHIVGQEPACAAGFPFDGDIVGQTGQGRGYRIVPESYPKVLVPGESVDGIERPLR